MTINMTIRDLDEKAYRKLKARAAEENINIGEAASKAFVSWAEQPKKKKGKAFLDVLEHPENWGASDASKIDEYIYG